MILDVWWNIWYGNSETFRTTFWGCPKMIQCSKMGRIILISSQEPSTASKYGHILYARLIILGSWNSAYNSRMTHNIDLWCKFDTKYDPILKNSSQEPSPFSKYECVLDAHMIMLGSWNFEYSSGITSHVHSRYQIWYQRWFNPPKLQSVIINILQVWHILHAVLIMLGSWKLA